MSEARDETGDSGREAAGPAMLGYVSGGAAGEGRGRRMGIYLRVTAAVFGVMALLIGWGLFDMFVLFWRRRWERGLRGIWVEAGFSPGFRWSGLAVVLPVVAVLLGFAVMYGVLAPMVARGNRSAHLAAALMAMIHALEHFAFVSGAIANSEVS